MLSFDTKLVENGKFSSPTLFLQGSGLNFFSPQNCQIKAGQNKIKRLQVLCKLDRGPLKKIVHFKIRKFLILFPSIGFRENFRPTKLNLKLTLVQFLHLYSPP